MPESAFENLRGSGPAFAGLAEIPAAAEPGHYSTALQVWVHEERPVAHSSLSHLKSDTIEGNED
ncbi:hypothetical protein [Amycolatopsis sp. WQ 127309]|uniref:hypothetical protein n=1 Tax=Amycolatopsis sp. WQ 127309 TaxID=2932773 RepID=UPI001FF5458A|nr:hypothetical protein [Amycolatopsis sp. WQ 127309]UOZ07588.1 hypothetical protein MUY22_04640 [Amycolatopsis sp. WQ 127309]